RRCWICCARTCEWHQKRLNSLSDSDPNADEAAVRHRMLEKWSTTDSFRVLKCPIATAVRASATRVQVPGGGLSVSCGWIHCEILARITTDPPAGSKSARRTQVRPQEACASRRPARREEGVADSGQIVALVADSPWRRARPSHIGGAEVADEGAGHLGEGAGGPEHSLQALVGHPAFDDRGDGVQLVDAAEAFGHRAQA